jgi:hypothetical protein
MASPATILEKDESSHQFLELMAGSILHRDAGRRAATCFYDHSTCKSARDAVWNMHSPKPNPPRAYGRVHPYRASCDVTSYVTQSSESTDDMKSR